jgi:hypothetical protein
MLSKASGSWHSIHIAVRFPALAASIMLGATTIV